MPTAAAAATTQGQDEEEAQNLNAGQPMTSESPTHYTSDWTPQDIYPDDPPW